MANEISSANASLRLDEVLESEFVALHGDLLENYPDSTEPEARLKLLIAEIFKDKGYQVELTPKTKDGGFDIRAFRRDDVGTCLMLVECKRYAPTNPVSVDIVRGLYGVSIAEGATTAIIATTSRFTKGALSFQAQTEYKLHLADFDNVKLWLARYKKRP
jgi:restriction endonuclease Mrr